MYVLARLWGHVTLDLCSSHSSLKKQDPAEVNGAWVWGEGPKAEPLEMVHCG